MITESLNFRSKNIFLYTANGIKYWSHDSTFFSTQKLSQLFSSFLRTFWTFCLTFFFVIVMLHRLLMTPANVPIYLTHQKCSSKYSNCLTFFLQEIWKCPKNIWFWRKKFWFFFLTFFLFNFDFDSVRCIRNNLLFRIYMSAKMYFSITQPFWYSFEMLFGSCKIIVSWYNKCCHQTWMTK